MDGPDPDSGTAFEWGCAYAEGKPVVCHRTEFRIDTATAGAPYSPMLSESATARFEVLFRVRPEKFRERMLECIRKAPFGDRREA